MTPTPMGGSEPTGSRGHHDRDEPVGPVIRDKRRLDPATGQLRATPSASPVGAPSSTDSTASQEKTMADDATHRPGEDPASAEPSAAAKEAAAKAYADVQASVPPKPRVEPEGEAAATPSGAPGGVPDDLSGLAGAGPAPVDPTAVEPGSDAALAAERLADLQRLQAEYVNYKRRVDRDRETQRSLTISAVMESLLPVLDEIHLARTHGDLVEGSPFAKIADKLESILTKYGVERYGEAGVPFDPTIHEALMHMQVELPAGTTETTVVQVMQPGYRLGDRIVRAAMVAVANPQ